MLEWIDFKTCFSALSFQTAAHAQGGQGDQLVGLSKNTALMSCIMSAAELLQAKLQDSTVFRAEHRWKLSSP